MFQSRKLLLHTARPEDLRPLRDLRVAAAEHLTERFGSGHWSHVTGLQTIRKHAQQGSLWVVYQKCGYTRVHGGEVNGVRLQYWEKRVSS